MSPEEYKRQEGKSRKQRFLNQMINDFNFAPKIAAAILDEVEDCLLGCDAPKSVLGQIRVNLLSAQARHGASVSSLPTTTVLWTLDDPEVDKQIRQTEGAVTLRQHRIQRLLNEAVTQHAHATQEDLANALQVSVRTIKRDCQHLRQQGVVLPTRGHLKQIGRGQTHKVQIVTRWLEGATFDQIARQTHHGVSCVRRYVQTFARVTHLTQQQFAPTEIVLVLQISRSLLDQYLHLLQTKPDTPFVHKRLQQQLDRLARPGAPKKRRVA